MKHSEPWVDLAGKWRTTVEMDDGTSQMLKFQSKPVEEEILAAAQAVIGSQS